MPPLNTAALFVTDLSFEIASIWNETVLLFLDKRLQKTWEGKKMFYMCIK